MVDYLQIIKKFYIIIIKILKVILFIRFFDRFYIFKKSYFRSLFSIHDLDELVEFDQIWINEKVKKYLNKHLKKNYSILEYGSGSSSFFFSKRVKKVLSIEHDKNYFEKVKFLNKDLNSKINFKLIEPEFDLSEKIFTSQKSKKYKNLSFKKYVLYPYNLKKKYDVVFVDGRCREKCLMIGAILLKKNGFIILDDSEKKRKRYQKYINLFNKIAKVNRFYGLNVCLPYKSETLIIKNINLKMLKKSKLFKEIMV